ncbi:MAG: hypothetical protein ACFFC1_20300, partial [Promethearchaeota archaeon]
DSEASNVKKRLKISNLPSGSSNDEKVKISSNDTTADYLINKIVASDESNTSSILEIKEVGDGTDEDLKIAIDESKITHQNINGAGTNTHSQIDTHIASTSNPHSVDKTDVGLSNVTNDAQVKKIGSSTDNAIIRWDGASGDTPQDSLATINDSGTINIPASQQYQVNGSQHQHVEADITDLDHNDTDAIHDNVASEIHSITEKSSLISADEIIIEDSADSYNKKRVQIGNLPSGSSGYRDFQFDAKDFNTILNSDWAVNAFAPLNLDDLNNALLVRAFDDTDEEGIGFKLEVPTGATNIVFDIKSRAATAPGSSKGVVPVIYFREIIPGSAMPSWSSGYDLTAITIPTNAYYLNTNQSIALSTLSITAGRIVLFELTRDPTDGSDDLSGDWLVNHLKVSFT